MRQKLSIVALIVVIASMGCGGTSQPTPTIPSAPAEEPAGTKGDATTSPESAAIAENESFSDEKLFLTFPAELGQLKFGGYESFEEPGMGYSIRYSNSDNMKVDIYVYDKGLLSIADGTTDPAVAKELASSNSTIRFFEEQGKYLDVKNLGEGVYPDESESDSVKYLFSRFQYRQTVRPGVTFAGQRISETYIRGFRDHFVKVRVSYPESSEKQSIEEREILLTHLSQSMASETAKRTPQ